MQKLRGFVVGLWRLVCELADADVVGATAEPAVTTWTKRFKYILQGMIGVSIMAMVLIQVVYVVLGYNDIFILTWVGKALIFSAAIDLAYMLFTPGPDEAIDPVIVAMAATVLIP